MTALPDAYAGVAFAASVLLAMLALSFLVGHRQRPHWGLNWLALGMGLAGVRAVIATTTGRNPPWELAALWLASGTLAALFVGLRRYTGLPQRRPLRDFVLFILAWQGLRWLAGLWGAQALAGPLTSGALFAYLALLCAGRLRPVSGEAHWLAAGALVLNPVLVLGVGIGVLQLDVIRLRGWSALCLAVLGLALLMAAMGRLRQEWRRELAGREEAEGALRRLNESLESRILQRTAQLEGLVDGLESFNRMVSHDLRGPLGGLHGVAGLARQALARQDLARADQLLGLMSEESARLGLLVQELLVLARVSNAELALCDTPLDEVLEQALQSLAMTQGEAAVRQVQAEPLPQAHVDAGLIRQVFVNLIGNALKFSHQQARPEVRVRPAQAGESVVIEVRDNGPGFDPARAEELFQPFRRLHGGEFEGSGIGLSIVRRIVERHGGHCWAEGRPQEGASFYFSLPPARLRPEPPAAPRPS